MKKKLLGIEPTDEGYPVCEIDESKIVENANVVYWMFGIVDRVSKDVRIFTVLNDRAKKKLLLFVSQNISTEESERMNMIMKMMENII